MKTRWALRFLLFVIGSYVAVAMVLRTEWAASRICQRSASVLSRLLGEPISLTRCEFDPLKTIVAVEGIQQGIGKGSFAAQRLEVHFSLLSLGRSFGISHVELVDPVLILDLSDAGEEDASAPTQTEGCLKALDRYPVDGASIRNAKISLRLPDGQSVELDGVNLETERAGRTQRLELEVGSGGFQPSEGPALSLNQLTAKLSLSAQEERLDIASFEAVALGATLSLRGEIRRLCAPDLAVRGNLVADLKTFASHLAPDLENVSGTLNLGASVAGPLGDLRADAILSLSSLTLDDLEPGDVSAGLRYAGGRLEIRDMVWPVGDGRAIVNGEVELSGRFQTLVEVRTEGLEFHRMMAKLPVKNTPVMMTIDSVHRLEGALAGGFFLEGATSLEFRDLRVRNVPWHEKAGTVVVEVPGLSTLDGKVRITAEGVNLTQGKAAFGPGTTMELAARLYFDEEKGLHIFARSPAFHLEHVRGHVAGIPIGGTGQMQAVIAGPYGDPTIEGDLDLADTSLFSGRLGRLQARFLSLPGQGELHFMNVLGEIGGTVYEGRVDLGFDEETSIDGDISIRRGGRLGDVFGASEELAGPFAWLHDHLRGSVDSFEAKFSGDLPDIRAEGKIQARDVRFLDIPFDSLEAVVIVPNLEQMQIEDFVAKRRDGVAHGSAEILFPEGAAASVDARIDAKGLPLRDLLGDFGETADLAGEVAATARLQGPMDRLDLRGDVYGSHLGAMEVALAPTHLSLETQGDSVVVRGAVAGAGNLSASIRFVDGLPFDASLDFDVPKLEEFLPTSSRIGGMVRGQATAAGTLSDILSTTGNVSLDELVLTLAEYRVESRKTTSMTYSGPAFVLYGLDLEGENTALSLYGNRSLAGAFDLQAQGTLDARLLGTLLPELEHPTGVISVKASMTGTAERPVLVGSAEVRRGGFRFRNLPLQIQGLSSSLAFSQNQVVIEEATMTANGGPASLRGSVSLRSFSPDVLDLLMTMDGMSWRFPADWPAVVSGKISLTGQWTNRILVSGEARINRLRWLKDLDLERAMLDFRKKVEVVSSPDEREWVRFDLDLLGGPDMRVDSNHVRARLQFVGGAEGREGRLRLVGSNVRPGLVGSVEISEGVTFFRGNEYRLTNGMVDFRERDRIDPSFDVTAETEVREYRITAHAFGKLEDFQLDLRSEPVLAQADVLTLLAFGITSRDLDAGGANALSGASVAAEALLTVSGLDEHVKRWIPNTPLLMDPDLSVTSQYSELTGQMEPMAVFEAKVLTDRLKLTATAPFATTKGRKAAAEVRVSDRLATQLSWQNEAVGYSSGDLGFDLKLRWEWE